MTPSLRRIIRLASSSKFKIWTGPAGVREIADAITRSGYRATPGTEHVTVDMPFSRSQHYDAAEALIQALQTTVGKTFGITIRDVQPY